MQLSFFISAPGFAMSLENHGPGNRVASSSAISLIDTSNVGGQSKTLYRIHGAFMIAAWICYAGSGMLVARFYKKTWVGKQSCGKDIWFSVSTYLIVF